MSYLKLQVATTYPFLRGVSDVEEMFVAAKAMGYSAIGMADHDTLAGISRAHGRTEEIGLRLLVGCRLTQRDSSLVLTSSAGKARGGSDDGEPARPGMRSVTGDQGRSTRLPRLNMTYAGIRWGEIDPARAGPLPF